MNRRVVYNTGVVMQRKRCIFPSNSSYLHWPETLIAYCCEYVRLFSLSHNLSKFTATHNFRHVCYGYYRFSSCVVECYSGFFSSSLHFFSPRLASPRLIVCLCVLMCHANCARLSTTITDNNKIKLFSENWNLMQHNLLLAIRQNCMRIIIIHT